MADSRHFVRQAASDDETEDRVDPRRSLPRALDDISPPDPIDAHLFRNRRAESDKTPAVQVNARDRLEFSDARFDSDLFAENTSAIDARLIESPISGAGELPLEVPPSARLPAPRRATRALAQRTGAIRARRRLLGRRRDPRRADRPSLPRYRGANGRVARPALAAWCQAVDCVLEAPRRIDDVLVESSALTRAIGLDAFVLSVTLKSRSSLALALPSVDLSLTDGNGRLVARRALAPRDFGAPNVIQPGAETALQLMLNAGGARVAGYTVEIFYP